METGKKTLILHGTKTSSVLNSVLTEIYHLKKDNAVKYSRRNDNIRPFESGGESSLEFFSLKTDCSLFVVRENSSAPIFQFFFRVAVLMAFFPLILVSLCFEVIENVCVGSCAERFVVWLESINTLMFGRISA